MTKQSHQPPATKIEPQDARVRQEDDFETQPDTIVEGKSLTNAELRQLAVEHHPPAEWFAGDEEDIF